jgi:hypothetical protein
LRRKINLSDKDPEKLQSLYLPSAVTKYREKQTDLPSLEKELSNHRPGFSPDTKSTLKVIVSMLRFLGIVLHRTSP